MKIVSAIDRIESTSHCTVFTAFVASITLEYCSPNGTAFLDEFTSFRHRLLMLDLTGCILWLFSFLAVVGLKTEKVLREVEKRELATDNRLPVRNVRVPGTGTDDIANNEMVENWWILKELPLW